jgi:hypothetical protein
MTGPVEALKLAIDDLEGCLSRQEVVRGEGVAVVRCQGLRLVLDALNTQGSGEGENAIGAAELAVGQFAYRRIEKLMDAKAHTPDGDELAFLLAFLAQLVTDVEEYGARGDEDIERTVRASAPHIEAQGSGEAVGVTSLRSVDDGELCEDCPAVGYPDKTRCLSCPRRVAAPPVSMGGIQGSLRREDAPLAPGGDVDASRQSGEG